MGWGYVNATDGQTKNKTTNKDCKVSLNINKIVT